MSSLQALGELSELTGGETLFHCVLFSPDNTTNTELHSSARTKPGASSGRPQHPPVPRNIPPTNLHIHFSDL